MKISKRILEFKSRFPSFFRITGTALNYFIWALFIVITLLQIYFNVVPFDEAIQNTSNLTDVDFYNNFFYQGRNIFYNDFLIDLFINSFDIIFISSAVVAFVGTWVLSQGRSAWEAFVLFLTLALPRIRREWGLVYNQEGGKPIEFVILRLYAVTVDEKKFLSQSITDLDGRYRIYLPEQYEKFILEIRADGYVATYQEIVQEKQVITFYANEIGLVKLDSTQKKKFNVGQFKAKVQKPMTYLVFILSTIVTTHSTYGMLAIPQIDTFIFFFMYGGAWVWNVKVLRERIRKIKGKIISRVNKKPVAGVTLRLFTNENKLVATQVTDMSGIANFNVEKGNYLLQTERRGSGLGNSMSVRVDAKGYLADNVFIDIEDKELSSQTIPNPFG
jgi:5-hydroxyisourate hydrolase-like protein (transthyretin family)